MKIRVRSDVSSRKAAEIFIFDERKGQPLFVTNHLRVKAQKEIAIKALSDMIRFGGVTLTPADLGFRRTLGCSCGCSPGLYVKGEKGKGHEYTVFYVTLSER